MSDPGHKINAQWARSRPVAADALQGVPFVPAPIPKRIRREVPCNHCVGLARAEACPMCDGTGRVLAP